MRLDVLPGSLWLAYGVTDRAALQARLPPLLRLAPIRLLADEGPLASECKLLFNAYDVEAWPWMRGHRVEVLTLAVHRRTGTPHLVVLDVLSDTMRWDPSSGVRQGNAVVARKPRPGADFHLEVRDRSWGGVLLDVAGRSGRSRPPDRRFVVDANRACYFGDHPRPYPMSFAAEEVTPRVRVLDRARVRNRIWENVRRPVPSHAFYHEQRMSFDVEVDDLWYD